MRATSAIVSLIVAWGAGCTPVPDERPTPVGVLPRVGRKPDAPPRPAVPPEPTPPPLVEPPPPREPPASEPGPFPSSADDPLGAGRPRPAPWPRDAGPVAASAFARRVVAATDVVGVVPLGGDGLLAVDATGGLFRWRGPGGFVAEITPLPPGVTRVETVGDAIVACAPAAGPAWSSVDGGRGFARLAFGCGFDGRRTVGGTEALAVAVLADGTFRAGPLAGGPVRRGRVPLRGPYTLGVDGDHVVVFGDDGAVWSIDGGGTFHPARLPEAGRPVAVRDVAFYKGAAVAVGEGGSAAVPALYSHDGGREWSPVADMPRRADDLAAVVAHPLGRVAAVPRVAGPVVESPDVGRTWWPISSTATFVGAVAPWGRGFVAGAPRGLARATDPAAFVPAAPLDAPLWDAAFTHPRVAIGAGVDGGLYATTDGGRRWWLMRGTAAVRFWGVDSPGGHTVVAVGDGVAWRVDDPRRGFAATELPSGCRARWVRFAPTGGDGLAGCDDGLLVRTKDGGGAWEAVSGAGVALGPAVWLGGGRVAALALGDGALWASSDAGATWRNARVPDDAVPVHLAPWGGGLSLVTADGRIAAASSADGPWPWTPPLDALWGPPDVRAHLPLGDGRVLLLTGDRLLGREAAGAVRALAAVPGARRLLVPGDGGLAVLQESATTLLEPR